MQHSQKNIILSLHFLQTVINKRLQYFFQKENAEPFDYPDLTLKPDDSFLNYFLVESELNIEEYIILLLSLAPHVKPNLIETAIQNYLPNGGDFPEFGGVRGTNHRGLLPTGETAQFILAGDNLKKRLKVQQLLMEGRLVKENILSLEPVKEGEPLMSGRLLLSADWLSKFLLGKELAPKFGPDFPPNSSPPKWIGLIL